MSRPRPIRRERAPRARSIHSNLGKMFCVIASDEAVSSTWRKFQSSFVRLPRATERFRPPAGGRATFSLRAHARAGARANGKAGPKGGGQDARSQEKVAKEKERPAVALSGLPALRVREAWPGFSAGLLSGRKGIAILGDARCAAFSSTPHRHRGAPEQQRAPSAQMQRPQQRHWMTRCARPFGAALRAFCALRACPAFAGMTSVKALSSQIRGGVATT